MDDMEYEEKVEKITECLEEVILNAILSVLKNIKGHYEFDFAIKNQTDRNGPCF